MAELQVEAQQKVNDLVQLGSAADYLAAFALHAPYTGYDHLSLIRTAENGLKRELFVRIKMQIDAPTRFDTWRAWVVMHDNLLYSAQRQVREQELRLARATGFNRRKAAGTDAFAPKETDSEQDKEKEQQRKEGGVLPADRSGTSLVTAPRRPKTRSPVRKRAEPLEWRASPRTREKTERGSRSLGTTSL